MTDEKVTADVQFIAAALSWYDGTEAATDVREAWSRLQAERDKLSDDVGVLKRCYNDEISAHVEQRHRAEAAEAKLTALVEALEESTRLMTNAAGYVISYSTTTALAMQDQRARNAELIAASRQALAHHSAPVGEPDDGQDRKFAFRNGQFVNRVSGEPIPMDEPIIIFRARDRHAMSVLEHYLDLAQDAHHQQAIRDRIAEFQTYREANPERLKEPGITRDITLSAPPSTPTSAPVEDVGGLVRQAFFEGVAEGAYPTGHGRDPQSVWLNSRAAQALAALSPALIQPQGGDGFQLQPVRDVVAECAAEGVGLWRPCSGCHETEDGYDVGHYPFSKAFGCKLGGGCHECGGIGAVWDTVDYAEMGRELSKDLTANPPQEERSDPLVLAAADDNRKGLAGAAATHSLTGAKVHIIGPDETDETKVRVRCFDGSEQSVRLSRLAIALPADDNHKALVEALREAEATFEDIRVRLISNLDEPERTAFWRAADGRTKVAQALAAFQSRQEESR